jgi:hypothetical protein
MPAPKDFGVSTHVLQEFTFRYTAAPALPAGRLVNHGMTTVASSAEPLLGVLRDDVTQGRDVSVGLAGIVEVISGAAIGNGVAITSDAAGQGVVAGAGSYIIGRALSTTAAAGQRFQMLITREGLS